VTEKKSVLPAFVLFLAIIFVILFTYLSLNLKSIDYGYKTQELLKQKKLLVSEIDKLKAKKEQLLNLERVEKIATKKLKYQYPRPEQFIKVFTK